MAFLLVWSSPGLSIPFVCTFITVISRKNNKWMSLEKHWFFILNSQEYCRHTMTVMTPGHTCSMCAECGKARFFCIVPASYIMRLDPQSSVFGRFLYRCVSFILVIMARVQLIFCGDALKKSKITTLPTSHSFRVLRHTYQWYIIKILVSS